ncbi:uncharacterized protein PAF06_004060 [Gastrophryne carolinensis]
MAMLIPLLLLFITGALTSEDLNVKNFLFPKQTATAHVILFPDIKKSLEKASICLQSYTELTRFHVLFSLATPGDDNALALYCDSPNVLSVVINQEANVFTIRQDNLEVKHICMTWDSTMGIVQLWLNGKLYPRRVSKKGFTLGAHTSIVLGQEQDSFGGGFEASQSFVGEMGDVNMWDYVLTPNNIESVMRNQLHGNLLNWKSLSYEVKGDVLLEQPVPCEDDLNVNNFLFPKQTATAHVILFPDIKKPLEKASICLQSYTELTRPHILFSLATPGDDNALCLYSESPNVLSVVINQEANVFTIRQDNLEVKHICMTWDSTTGIVQLWLNGKLYPRRVSKKGFTLGAHTSIVLGQEQDSFGGGFEASQSFVGEMGDVNMWDYVLTPNNIESVMRNQLHGNLLNWRSLSYEVKGDVLVVPRLQCWHLEYYRIFNKGCQF